jgi:hypothetical protein
MIGKGEVMQIAQGVIPGRAQWAQDHDRQRETCTRREPILLALRQIIPGDCYA